MVILHFEFVVKLRIDLFLPEIWKKISLSRNRPEKRKYPVGFAYAVGIRE